MPPAHPQGTRVLACLVSCLLDLAEQQRVSAFSRRLVARSRLCAAMVAAMCSTRKKSTTSREGDLPRAFSTEVPLMLLKNAPRPREIAGVGVDCREDGDRPRARGRW